MKKEKGRQRKPSPSSSSLPLCKIQPWLQISEGDVLDLGKMAVLDFGGER
jgi:hypothetical protein